SFVLDAIPNKVRASTAAVSPSFFTPNPFATTTWPSFTTLSARPGTWNVFIARATYASRSGGAGGRDCAVASVAATSKAVSNTDTCRAGVRDGVSMLMNVNCTVSSYQLPVTSYQLPVT